MQVGLQAKFRYTNTYATIALWILCLNMQSSTSHIKSHTVHTVKLSASQTLCI